MLRLKPFRQTPALCGVASLKMVLEYFGAKKTEKELIKLAGASERYGTPVAGLLRAARKLGFQTFCKDNTNFSDIKKYLNKKIPVIVDWFNKDDGHYSVVVELDKKYIYLMDPESATVRKLDRATFKRIWFDFPGDYLKNKKDVIIRRMIVVEP